MSHNKTNALFLYPKIPDWTIDSSEILGALDTLGFIDNSLPDKSDCFYAGDQFLSHITFLGCAPNIQFTPTEDKSDFCFIRLINSNEVKMIHTLSMSRSPRCPDCKQSLKNWQDFPIKTPWQCPHCSLEANPYEYNWQRTAGFARLFIEITDIYPKEAIPQPSLLDKLASLTQVEWDYFYFCP